MCELFADIKDICNLNKRSWPKFSYSIIGSIHFGLTSCFFPSISSKINISVKSQSNIVNLDGKPILSPGILDFSYRNNKSKWPQSSLQLSFLHRAEFLGRVSKCWILIYIIFPHIYIVSLQIMWYLPKSYLYISKWYIFKSKGYKGKNLPNFKVWT